MSKESKLIHEVGQNIVESVTSVNPVHGGPQGEHPAEDKYAGRRRYREAGQMEIDRIMPDPDQPRKTFDAQALAELSESVKQRGLLQPIGVRWSDERKNWIITYGERRYRAAKLAGLKSIPCIFTEDEQDESETRIRQLIENSLRENLLPLEQAQAFRALLDLTGWSTRQLAKEVRIGKTSIIRHLALLKLPEAVQQKVHTGELAPSVAYEISQVESAPRQIKLAKQVIAGGLNRQEATKLVKQTDCEHQRQSHSFTDPSGIHISVSHDDTHTSNAIATVLRQFADTIESV